MKSIADYVFRDSWQLRELGLEPERWYRVVADIAQLKTGTLVCFAGFDDVDNHYGIFVFTTETGEILEVVGDFSSRDHSMFRNLHAGLQPVRS